MRRVKKLAVALLTCVPVAVLITWCSFTLGESLGKCDFEGYLTDQKTQEELFVAVRKFERQHNLRFGYGWAAPSCTIGGIEVALEYETPLHLSKYGIRYELLVFATYSPSSRAVTLQIDDQFSETEDALDYIICNCSRLF